jgi:hypothetical protein
MFFKKTTLYTKELKKVNSFLNCFDDDYNDFEIANFLYQNTDEICKFLENLLPFHFKNFDLHNYCLDLFQHCENGLGYFDDIITLNFEKINIKYRLNYSNSKRNNFIEFFKKGFLVKSLFLQHIKHDFKKKFTVNLYLHGYTTCNFLEKTASHLNLISLKEKLNLTLKGNLISIFLQNCNMVFKKNTPFFKKLNKIKIEFIKIRRSMFYKIKKKIKKNNYHFKKVIKMKRIFLKKCRFLKFKTRFFLKKNLFLNFKKKHNNFYNQIHFLNNKGVVKKLICKN